MLIAAEKLREHICTILQQFFFIGFFPQMVAGPIVRAFAFLPQLQALRRFSDVDVRGALVLFLVGFFKKVALADYLAKYVDQVYGAPSQFQAPALIPNR